MNRYKNRQQNKKNGTTSGEGFFLVEIVISLLLISVGLVIYASASNTVILNRTAKYQDVANQIAASKMDDLRNAGFAGLPPTGSFTHPTLSSLPSGTGTVTVTAINDTLKNVKVRVVWWDRGRNTQRALELETLISKNGL